VALNVKRNRIGRALRIVWLTGITTGNAEHHGNSHYQTKKFADKMFFHFSSPSNYKFKYLKAEKIISAR